jgi:hypothetical protein
MRKLSETDPILLLFALKRNKYLSETGAPYKWTRNPPEELLFSWKSPALGRGIHRKNGNSDGNYQFMDMESTCGEVFLREVILLRITSAQTRNPPEEG